MVIGLGAALLDALAVLLPVACAGCGADDRALCAACRAQLRPVIVRQVLGDGMDVVSALRYEGEVRRIVLAFKEQGRTDVAGALARPLGEAIAAAAAGSGSGSIELAVPPTGRASYRRRGYDPVRLLLRRAGLGAPVAVLVGVQRRDEQKLLGREARIANLAGSLRAREDVRGRRFVLVDDVVTTGATLVEAARALRAGGAEVVGAATLTATPRLLPYSRPPFG